MLVNSIKMLNTAKDENKAVFQFNINNLEWTKCILEECNSLSVPVILGVSESAIKYMGGYDVISSIVNSLIKDLDIKIDVCLHLDHGSSFLSCKEAIDSGFTSVMIDMSKESFEKNVLETKKVVDYAKQYNVSVEAEIGSVGSITNELKLGKLTNLSDCIKFIEETKIDSLAPAVGTVHGIYTGNLNIDYNLIQELAKNTKVPLVLHGGSGLDNNILKKCISCGINKININSDIQKSWSLEVRKFLKNNEEVIDPRKVIGSGFQAIKDVVSEKINISK